MAEGRSPQPEASLKLGEVDHLGLDETAFQAANAKRHTSYVTGIVDYQGRPFARPHRGSQRR
jgi:hypothetical protein